MAMRQSAELSKLIVVLYQELTKLDAQLDRCFIMIVNPENQGITWWLAGKEGLMAENGFFIQMNQHPSHLMYLDHWQKRTKKWQYLFEGKENFAKKQSTDKVTLSIENNSAIWSLESLPEGHYIIIAYHDENENQKIDLGIMGIPAEGYAFSNNTVSEMGPPNPDQMLFEVKSDETTTQVLKMVYFDFSVLQME